MQLLTLCVICGFLVAQIAAAATSTNEKDVDESSDSSDLFGEAVRGIEELFGVAEDDSDGSDGDNASGSGNKSLAENKAHSDDIMDIDALLQESLEDFESIKQDMVNGFLKSLRDMIEVFLPPEEMKVEDNKQEEQSNTQQIVGSTSGDQAINGSSTSNKNHTNESKEGSLEEIKTSTIVENVNSQTVTNSTNNTTSEENKTKVGE